MKFSRGLLTGSILGAVAGMMILPKLNNENKNQNNNSSNMNLDKINELMTQNKTK